MKSKVKKKTIQLKFNLKIKYFYRKLFESFKISCSNKVFNITTFLFEQDKKNIVILLMSSIVIDTCYITNDCKKLLHYSNLQINLLLF